MGTTQELARYVVEAKFEDFPTEAVERAKELFIDFIGSSLGGTTTRLGKTITEYVREMGAAPEVGVIGCGFRTTAGNAAWVNTGLAHVLELESMGARGALNPAPLLAVALAVGEKVSAGGKEVSEGCLHGPVEDPDQCPADHPDDHRIRVLDHPGPDVCHHAQVHYPDGR